MQPSSCLASTVLKSVCAPSPKQRGVNTSLVIHYFGSQDSLREACDAYITEEGRSGKSAAMKSRNPAT